MNRSRRPDDPNQDVAGRALIAAANALLVFVTGCAIWLLLFRTLFATASTPPPFLPVIIFTALMGALSFVLEIDVVPRIFFRIWKLLVRLFSHLF